MKKKKQRSKQRRSQQALLTAILLSLLLHQLLLTGLGSVFSFPEEEKKEKRHEVSLLTEPEPVKEAPEKKPEKKIEKKKAPAPKPIRQAAPAPRAAPPVQPRPRPEPMPEPENAPPEESGPPEETQDELATVGPTPDPSAPPSPPKLNLNWKSFDKIFGADAAAQREAYTAAALEKRRNRGAFGNYSARVMRALKNNKSFIKAGEQEPLGTRKAAFHNYIDAVHAASIHPKFADSFLASLPMLSASDPLNNMDLHMVAEFEIFESGHISEIRVIKTSGNTIFDAGAVDAIYQSAPFPPPPKEVLSWNRRVYLRWGFYRNNRKCGVFNVEPYILRAPGAKEEALPVDKFTVTGG
jgi:TonB family protein